MGGGSFLFIVFRSFERKLKVKYFVLFLELFFCNYCLLCYVNKYFIFSIFIHFNVHCRVQFRVLNILLGLCFILFFPIPFLYHLLFLAYCTFLVPDTYSFPPNPFIVLVLLHVQFSVNFYSLYVLLFLWPRFVLHLVLRVAFGFDNGVPVPSCSRAAFPFPYLRIVALRCS